jgi:succinate dehydrogenase / fumarate reductase membrane anchor subunit
MANNNDGAHRLVVGAHYGLRDWLAQRLTAIVMALYTVILLVTFLTGSNFSYEGWAGMFAHQWFKIATFVAFVALFYHAWVGMREILMDYANPAGLRLCLHGAVIVWLIGCAGWAAQIIWRA